MVRIVWSPDAVTDLEDISQYISLDSKENATVVVRGIFATAESVSLFPLSGRIVPEFEKKSIREKLYQSYRIIYRIKSSDHIDIVRIFHQARELNINMNKTT
ncbi:type II toxin-antitoxin system RelE/ParE family toxin [Bacillus sp. SD088]|uniref:type II toxin-antitoxin system RelE/ParE family toxin n=1 Tax=Bacillus sp. SD088 TaxID=2782012 RepID=UPI001A972C8F|nr:type II toxin-antitoxin system RelE/ParE family toxin [Bacillus sp. SD088]MBO0992449.1 type II toxin-antitoxin system RelE/ParE family toxin [Bacillus sp. SD088]